MQSLLGPGSTIGTLIFTYATPDIRIKIARSWGVKIGKNCRIYPCNFGIEPYLISIGDHCEITPGVIFITNDAGTWVFRENQSFKGSTYGPIFVRDNSIIGVNSIILPNVSIGPNSVVGAGSVVTRDVPPDMIYAGNPATFICTLDEYLKKCNIKNTGIIPNKDKKQILLKKFHF